MVASTRARASAAVRPGWRFQGPISPDHPCARSSVTSQAPPGPRCRGSRSRGGARRSGRHRRSVRHGRSAAGTGCSASPTRPGSAVRSRDGSRGADRPARPAARGGRGRAASRPAAREAAARAGVQRAASAECRRRAGPRGRTAGSASRSVLRTGARRFRRPCGRRLRRAERGLGDGVVPARDDLLPRLGVVQPGSLAVELFGGEDSGRHKCVISVHFGPLCEANVGHARRLLQWNVAFGCGIRTD